MIDHWERFQGHLKCGQTQCWWFYGMDDLDDFMVCFNFNVRCNQSIKTYIIWLKERDISKVKIKTQETWSSIFGKENVDSKWNW